MEKITTVEKLLQVMDSGRSGFFVRLKNGLRSSKYINLIEDFKFYIYHEAHDFEETVKNFEESILFEAMQSGALYAE